MFEIPSLSQLKDKETYKKWKNSSKELCKQLKKRKKIDKQQQWKQEREKWEQEKEQWKSEKEQWKSEKQEILDNHYFYFAIVKKFYNREHKILNCIDDLYYDKKDCCWFTYEKESCERFENLLRHLDRDYLDRYTSIEFHVSKKEVKEYMKENSDDMDSKEKTIKISHYYGNPKLISLQVLENFLIDLKVCESCRKLINDPDTKCWYVNNNPCEEWNAFECTCNNLKCLN